MAVKSIDQGFNITFYLFTLWALNWGGVYTMEYGWRPEENLELSPIFLPYRSWGSNQDYQAWPQAPLPTEPACQLLFPFIKYVLRMPADAEALDPLRLEYRRL